jgi:hypothetical protein
MNSENPGDTEYGHDGWFVIPDDRKAELKRIMKHLRRPFEAELRRAMGCTPLPIESELVPPSIRLEDAIPVGLDWQRINAAISAVTEPRRRSSKDSSARVQEHK